MARYNENGMDGLPSIYDSKLGGSQNHGLRENSSRRIEIEDELQRLRDELQKRDDVIRELTNMNGRNWSAQNQAQCRIEPFPSVRSELAAMQAKVDSLYMELRNKQLELDALIDANSQLRSAVDHLKESNARQLALNAGLTRQLECCKANQSSIEAEQYQSEHAQTSFQEQHRSAKERIFELETQVKECLESSSKERDAFRSFEGRTTEFLKELICKLGAECGPEDLDCIRRQVSDIMQENMQLKFQSGKQKQQMQDHDAEMRANRETIQRLLAELSLQQRENRQHQERQSELKLETEKFYTQRGELQYAQDKLTSIQKKMDATSLELVEKDMQVKKLQSEACEGNSRADEAEKRLSMFIESLASTLSSACGNVTQTAEGVQEKVRLLCHELSEQNRSTAELNDRFQRFNEQFEAQCGKKQEAEEEYRKAQHEFRDLKERLAALQGELAAGDVIRDGLRADVQKFYAFMQQLSEVMKMEKIGEDIGFGMLGNALLARAKQLTCLSDESAHNKKTVIYNLQRKLKSMKEQLESRDLHMELLRKKMAQLEERAAGRMSVERDRDNESDKVSRLQKHLEKVQNQFEQARAEIVRLKAQLLECSNLKLTALEQDRELATLESSLDKLERVRQKQAKRIAELKSESEDQKKTFNDSSNITNGTVSSLSNELQSATQLLEDTQRRERQLIQLRAVIARMLGLDVESLAVPDYEIVNRLERVIQVHQTNAITLSTVQHQAHDMDNLFHRGCLSSFVTSQQQRKGICEGHHRDCREVASGNAWAHTRSASPARDSVKY